jgi:hypothetical protein
LSLAPVTIASKVWPVCDDNMIAAAILRIVRPTLRAASSRCIQCAANASSSSSP